MCKRDTQDPLVRSFLDRYHLNLLSVPRDGAAVGDVYVDDGKRVAPPGNVTNLLQPAPTMPPIRTGEAMADIAGQLSESISAKLGLNFLKGFLAALGAVGLAGAARAQYTVKRVQTLRFRFTDATRDSVDPLALGAELDGKKIRTGNAMYAEGNRYYLVTGVARSPSISVIAQSEREQAVDVDVDAINIAGVSAGVAVRRTSDGELTYVGPKHLAFGVELFELTFDTKRSQLRLRIPDKAVKTMAGPRPGEGKLSRLVQPALLGGPKGDAFVELAGG